MQWLVFLVVALGACAAAKLELKRAPDVLVDMITEADLRAHLRFMSDPMLEGRFAGSRGEELAAKHIAATLEAAGVKPLGDAGKFIQKVPLRKVTPNVLGPLTIRKDASTSATFTYGNDYVASTQTSKTAVSLSNDELVFVGYGGSSDIWDDYKGYNVSGKVVLVLLGQPADGFAGAMGGRMTTKVAIAIAKGAKAVVGINVAAKSGYQWASFYVREGGPLVRNTWDTTPQADLYLYLNESDGNTLGAMYGKSVAAWYAEAEQKTFAPYSLGTISVDCTFTNALLNGNNVVGIIPGYEKDKEAVVLSAHIDHLGVGWIDGKVYPGANDNSGGSTVILNIATALARWTEMVPLRRSVIFLFTTAEEHGLYGATWWLMKAVQAKEYTILANINFDTVNIWSKTHDMIVFGRYENTMATEVADFAGKAEGITMSPDPSPASGTIVRADSYVFHVTRIPFLWPFIGVRAVGKENVTRPDGVVDPTYYMSMKWYIYSTMIYHTPNDVYDDSKWDWSAVAQHARFGLRAAYAVAAGKYVPKML